MIKHSLIALSLMLGSAAHAQQNIIPKPLSVEQHAEEAFCLNAETSIYYQAEQDKAAVELLASLLRQGTALPLPVKHFDGGVFPQNAIIFGSSKALTSSDSKEAYTLSASPAYILCYAASPDAIMRAYASLVQMLPLAYHQDDKALKSNTTWQVGQSAFSMSDQPRFAWRAFMLDEARHFFGKEAVKALLDQMCLLKFNVLHWHLTDNDGWRVEIKKYPRLTEVGSKRADTEAITWKSGKSIGKPHEGFYTQEDIKEIVAYAAKRGITIVPEFDVPGHSSAASVAYPWLSLKPLGEMPTKFGSNAALDPTKESTYTFVSDVFDELAQLFPSKYLHFGGDEVRFSKQWQDVPEINTFMKEHGYTSLAEVQMHFTNRVEKIIRSKGRQAMGWNEILGGDVHGDGGGKVTSTINPSTLIHYWAGPQSMIKLAVEKGHLVVNSNHFSTYLDYNYKRIPLQKSYDFEPVIAGLTPEQEAQIIGLGTQMWTEWTPTLSDMQRQAFPRCIAIAEVGWTAKENKNFPDFQNRLTEYQRRLDALQINYHKEANTKPEKAANKNEK